MTRVLPEQEPLPEPDVVLYVPREELLEIKLQPNPSSYDPQGEPRGRRPHTLEHPALDLYNGYDGLLVRTALIRSRDYDAGDVPTVTSAADAANLCRHLVHATNEHLVSLALNARSEVIAIHEASIGPADHTAFTVRQVLQVAFLTSAHGLIMVHNHPSGMPLPSADDCYATAAVGKGATCAGIHLLDSLIVGARGFFSFRERIDDLAHADELVPRIHAFRYERWQS